MENKVAFFQKKMLITLVYYVSKKFICHRFSFEKSNEVNLNFSFYKRRTCKEIQAITKSF